MHRFGLLLLIVFCMAWRASLAAASTYIDIEDAEIYTLLSRLEAEGVIQDALLSTRPLSRREVVRLVHEAEENAEGRSDFINSLVMALRRRVRPWEFETGGFKPLESVYAQYIRTSADVLTVAYSPTFREKEQALNYNNDGDLYGRGSNYRAGFTSRLEELGPISAYLNPEYRQADGSERLVLKKGYAVLGFSWLDIVIGKDSQWWGPGRNSANLLSNNAEPLTMIKLTSPEPLHLPWILEYLGPVQYTLFVARLEKNRSDFPEPFLDGIRLDFKPHPLVEIGFERITLLGGHGRPLSGDAWTKSFIGIHGHPNIDTPDSTDSEAGGDIKVTLPFHLQPLQVYWQRDGEDNRQYTFGLPYKFQDLYGIYLPRVLHFERIGLRAEYAVNHINGWPNYWYNHSIYTSGMTYNGMTIGHHMGTDSRDVFLELVYLQPEKNARFSLSYDQQTHNLSGPVKEVSKEFTLTAALPLSRHVDITASYGHGRIENPGNIAGPAREADQIKAEARYWF